MAVDRKLRASAGFSLVEVMIAMVVLAVGLLSILGMFAFAMTVMQDAQNDLIAREKAKDALENVFSARDTGQITFNQIQNSSTPPGIFDPNPQPIYVTRGDGLINSSDYIATGGVYETVTLPGPDGILGTADDIQVPLSNFSRTITISPVKDAGGGINPDLRQIAVTVQYQGERVGKRQYTTTGYISRYH